MHPVVMWKSRKLEIKKSLPKFGRRYEVKYEYCQHAIQWCIDYYTSDEGYYDLIPQLSCYQNLCYNPYDLIKEYNDYIESIVMNATETLTVDKIISFLINSLEKDQSSKLELLAKSNR